MDLYKLTLRHFDTRIRLCTHTHTHAHTHTHTHTHTLAGLRTPTWLGSP